MLSFDALRETNVARCEASYRPLGSWSAPDWACAMGGECGEALSLVTKLHRLNDGNGTHEQSWLADRLVIEIGYELADLVIYADLLAARLGLNLGQCVTDKFNATSEMIGSARRL